MREISWVKVGLLICIIAAVIIIPLATNTRNLEYLKDVGPSYLEGFGFEIIGYEGFHRSVERGAKVWFMVEKEGLIYSVYLTRTREGDIVFWRSHLGPWNEMKIDTKDLVK